jgi:hypothetical protein
MMIAAVGCAARSTSGIRTALTAIPFVDSVYLLAHGFRQPYRAVGGEIPKPCLSAKTTEQT